MTTFRPSRSLPALTAAVFSAFALAACDDGGTDAPEQNLVEIAVATPEASTLVAALEASGLDATLAGEGPFTVFAPVNSAFSALPAGTVEALLESDNAAILTDLLTYHVVSGEVMSSDLSNGQMVNTVEGGQLRITVDSEVRVNGARVITADIPGSNGVIHLIDGVLTEGLDVVQRASVTPIASTLVAAVTAADLGSTLSGTGPFTVFAPTDAAFAALPEGTLESLLQPENVDQLRAILTYHVIAGDIRASDLTDGAQPATVQGETVEIDLDGGAKVNGSNIIVTDIVTSNGVIHLIDAVLLPSN